MHDLAVRALRRFVVVFRAEAFFMKSTSFSAPSAMRYGVTV
jgi:hypothetical protein